MSNIQFGTTVLGSNPNQTSTNPLQFNVQFNAPFSEVPVVVVTPASVDPQGLTDTFSSTVVNVTTGGFLVNILRSGGVDYTWGQKLQLNWIAVTN